MGLWGETMGRTMCHPERQRRIPCGYAGGVLFAGFFTASRFRMTEGSGRLVKRPCKGRRNVGAIHESPVLGAEKAGEKGRRGRRPLRGGIKFVRSRWEAGDRKGRPYGGG